jgi:ATP-dependent exoDNAse (exonuclease V) alpha subunit
MAIYRLQISSISRSAGRRATAAAAYRAGERVRDERSGKLNNFSHRRDVLHAEIFLPRHLESASTAWARNRERLWNTAEHAEKRQSARIAREYEVSLPPELSSAQRIALARAFSEEIAERYKVAVDLAVHAPRPGSDPRNFHAHLLSTTREVTPAGLGAKAGIDMSPRERQRRELPDHRQEYFTLRERWAALTNDALREANLSVRVDHRSLLAQGIDREPQPRIPLMHLKMEQRGVHSGLAERLRAQYRERQQQRIARSRGATAGEPVRERNVDAASPRVPSAAGSSPATSGKPWDMEEIRRQAREAWVKLRSSDAAKGSDRPRAAGQGTAHGEAATERAGPDAEAPGKDDLAL